MYLTQWLATRPNNQLVRFLKLSGLTYSSRVTTSYAAHSSMIRFCATFLELLFSLFGECQLTTLVSLVFVFLKHIKILQKRATHFSICLEYPLCSSKTYVLNFYSTGTLSTNIIANFYQFVKP